MFAKHVSTHTLLIAFAFLPILNVTNVSGVRVDLYYENSLTEFQEMTSGENDNSSSSSEAIVITSTTSPSSACLTDSNSCQDDQKYCSNGNCICKPGSFESKTGATCSSTLEFGGKLSLASSSFRQILDVNIISEVEKLLVEAYNSTIKRAFISVNVFEMEDSDYDYLLRYDTTSDIEQSLVRSDLTNYFVKKNCSKDEDLCSIGNLQIKRADSLENAGSVSSVVCNQYPNYCDRPSTICDVKNGKLSCNCANNHIIYDPPNVRACQAILCENDSECNAPFGACDKKANGGVGRCTCMFGFSSDHCQNPWLFIFVIVAPALALGMLISLTYICVTPTANSKKQNDKRKHGETSYVNPYFSMEQEIDTSQYRNGKMRAQISQDLNVNNKHYQ